MMLDIERAKRYRDKLNLILERSADLEGWTSAGKSNFIHDKKTRLAVYQAFQELTGASFDILATVCRDSGINPRDDYTNIEALFQKNILNEPLKEALAESNGLRNRLVHRYNTMDEGRAYESITRLLHSFKVFTGVMNLWLKEHL